MNDLRPKVGIIIPVYNTEKYLEKCLESVCRQTLKNIHIFLVDDGSTDSSKQICERFAASDSRITLLHGNRQGCYAARAVAIQQAKNINCEYIGFVDSDDWIEPNMFEKLYNKAKASNVDIVECGYNWEYPNCSFTWIPETKREYDSTEALCLLFQGKSCNYMWNKLWKTDCVDKIFYLEELPDYEDMVITFKTYLKIHTAIQIQLPLYHYRQNASSIVYQKDMRLLHLWHNHQNRYQFVQEQLKERIDDDTYAEVEDSQLRKCVNAIGKNWVWWIGNSKEEQRKNQDELKRMSQFVWEHTPLFGRKNWHRNIRFISFIARFPYRPVLWIAWQLNHLDLKFRYKIYE